MMEETAIRQEEERAADGAAEEIREQQEEVVEKGVHNYSTADRYVRPQDPAVLKKLEWFQDQKLALMNALGPLLPAGRGGVLGAFRRGCGVVPHGDRLGSQRQRVQETVFLT